MRNLQKILALALALIMSFSLVVTANAAFSDEADIDETYAESVNVLAQLEVFKGYKDGSYQPKADISRAEVAAIIYRIATGDVTDSQVSLYSDWNRFKDVKPGDWYAGYVNYCANAEYIKGYGDGNFRPQQNVTGYEALAMILRAVGYGKMDEFVGSDWAVNTAARANSLKISRNVTAALLGSAASREVVAELLFRSILVPTVTYNNAFGYQETDATLAYNSFKLEEIEGVVVANEYANLYDIQVLDAGKTDLEIAKGTIRSLDIPSEITAIGEKHKAYISGAKVYALENTGDNVVFEPENGKGTKIEGSNFLKNTGLKKDGNTEFYLNFGREGKFSCDYRLEFSVEFKAVGDKRADDIRKAFEADYKVNLNLGDDVDDPTPANADPSVDAQMDVMAYADLEHAKKDDAGNEIGTTIGYELIIRANEEINEAQLKAIKGIFAAADDDDLSEGIAGAVYIGTKSTKDDANINRYKDASDEMSYRTFYNEYINSEIWDQDIQNSGNGEWLKVVDNDGDGVAEYAFLTQYTLDKAISSYTKSGETILEFNSVDVEAREDDDGIVDIAEDIAVGDVVYYTDIDNRVTMTKAPVVTAQIKSISFKDDTCTTTEDTTYTESDIFNSTRLDQEVENMDDEVRYNLYFDAYGYLRAYELADGNKYGLLTELYKTRTQNNQYVTGVDLTVELKKGAEKLDEFDVSNSKNNIFLLDENNTDGTANWEDLHDNLWTGYTDDRTILLQPAAGRLGEVDLTRNNIFAHPDKAAENATYATTNVAVYTETADGEVRLTSPVKLAKDTHGDQYYYTNGQLSGEKTTVKTTGWEAYEVDYIALDLSDGVKADAKHYPISDSSRYANQSNSGSNYVDAVHDTEFYVVNTASQKVDYFTDYEKVYALKAEDITAAYAVARNTVADMRDSDYWVADVVVIEVKNIDTIYDSVSILFNNPSQVSGSVKRLETLNTESENPEIDMILDSGRFDWNPRDNGNWAYEIDEKEIKDGDLYADSISPITEKFNAKGLYAGTVSRIRDIRDRGGYIDILMHGADTNGQLRGIALDRPVDSWREGINVTNEILFAIGSKNGSANANTTLRDLRLAESTRVDRLAETDRVIWGEDKDGHVAFVIDIDFVDDSWYAPEWVERLWKDIVEEQIAIKQRWTFAEALEAFLKWQGTQDAADKTAAENAVKGALSNTDITGKDRDRLEEMKAVLNGGSGDAEALVAAYKAWNAATGDAKKAALIELYKKAAAYTATPAVGTDEKVAKDAAVAQANTELTAFNSAIKTGGTAADKISKMADAAGKIPSAEAVAIATTPKADYTTNKAAYDTKLPLYTKAKALIVAYNAWNAAALPSEKTALRPALDEAYAAAKEVNDAIKSAFSDSNAAQGYEAAYGAVPVDGKLVLTTKANSGYTYDAGTVTLTVPHGTTAQSVADSPATYLSTTGSVGTVTGTKKSDTTVELKAAGANTGEDDKLIITVNILPEKTDEEKAEADAAALKAEILKIKTLSLATAKTVESELPAAIKEGLVKVSAIGNNTDYNTGANGSTMAVTIEVVAEGRWTQIPEKSSDNVNLKFTVTATKGSETATETFESTIRVTATA